MAGLAAGSSENSCEVAPIGQPGSPGSRGGAKLAGSAGLARLAAGTGEKSCEAAPIGQRSHGPAKLAVLARSAGRLAGSAGLAAGPKDNVGVGAPIGQPGSPGSHEAKLAPAIASKRCKGQARATRDRQDCADGGTGEDCAGVKPAGSLGIAAAASHCQGGAKQRRPLQFKPP